MNRGIGILWHQLHTEQGIPYHAQLLYIPHGSRLVTWHVECRRNGGPCLAAVRAVLQNTRRLRSIGQAYSIKFITVTRINGKLATASQRSIAADILPLAAKVRTTQDGIGGIVACYSLGCAGLRVNSACIEDRWITIPCCQGSQRIAVQHLYPLTRRRD